MAKRKASPSESDSDGSGSDVTFKRRRLEEDILAKEKEFEAKNIQKAEADIKAREAHQGAIYQRAAECGIIQSLEMHQFMCHPRLSFTFGPQINFIIGHNGSGKSAVLSAIAIALGGKSITTGRGTSLKSFIREGQSQAEVTITLKNEGQDAFRHDVYGDSIVITRKLSKDGSSSYKIKSKAGLVVSTKKKELSDICEHMNIQIDNPLNVLTQDSARQFLSTTDAADRYSYFLRGTQLKQLIEDYDECIQQDKKMVNSLKAKAQALPFMKEAAEKAAVRYKAAEKAIQMREKIATLKKELAWSIIEGKEEELQAKVEEVATISHRIQKLQKNVDDAKVNLDAASQQIIVLEGNHAALGNMDKLVETRDNLQEEIRENKARVREYQDNMKDMNEDLQSNNQQIQDLDGQILEENQKMEIDKQAERRERQLQLDEIKKSMEEQSVLLNVLAADQSSKRDCLADLTRQINDATTEKGKSEQETKDCHEQLQRIEQQSKNRLNAFGRNVEDVLRRISECQWYGQKPVGPLGCFIKLQDQQWAQVMRIQLGALVRSFAITHHRDKEQMRRILAESRNSDMQIIVAEVDMFDFGDGEPPSNILTVLRALTFTNEYVKRIFITQARIERILLAPRRIDGEQVARAIPGGGTVWTAAEQYRVTIYNDGGASSSPMTKLSRNDPRMQLFMDSDLSNEEKKWKEREQKARTMLTSASNFIDQTSITLNRCENELNELNTSVRAINVRLREFQRQLDVLIEQDNEDVPVDIAALQDTKRDLENLNESIRVQFEHAMKEMTDLENRRQPLKDALELTFNQLEDLEREKSVIQGLLDEAITEHVKATHNLEHWKSKLQPDEVRLSALEEVVLNLQKDYEDSTKDAEEYCDGERVVGPRRTDEVQRLIRSSEEALEEQERSRGSSIEEIECELLEARRKYHKARKDINEAKALNKTLRDSTDTRIVRWHEFRMYCALLTKLQFKRSLTYRKYCGKALFDHINQKLELIVLVDRDQMEHVQSPNKEKTKALSGGEKSFSTLSFLLSLWEVIQCPIRCLDEFDVFMDAANRRTSMEMMINFANSTDRQYILITPQDMSAVQLKPSVRVHRMGDPERGQTTLPF